MDKDKSIRLLNYLEELTRLRIRTVKDVDSYHKVLWLYQIPQNSRNCFTRAWGSVEDIDSDIWLQVKKYDEPVLEDIPEACEDWIDNARLYDTLLAPKLLDSIQVQIKEENTEWQPDDPEDEKIRIVNRTVSLTDYPDVQHEWDKFIAEKWIPWSEIHKKWQRVQNVYSTLFSIHQDQLKLGEEYELVLGLGFLRWETGRGYSAKRHLIVANANLDFDTKMGQFTINPAIGGSKVSLEFDMLEPDDQPTYKIRKPIEEMLTSANGDPWNKSVIDIVQKSLVNVLGKGQGEYHSNNLELGSISDKTKPLINFAPALILRKRNTKSLQEVIQRIREQINNDVIIPKEFIELCEGKIKDGRLHDDVEEIIDKRGSYAKVIDSEIYFPLPSNEAQNEIISKARTRTGVLVQGPPGTGKTHTIANLICHLLATGQRVLVTAKTPRALRVLKDKLPESVQPLCINLLGSGIEEQKSLESSVTNILINQDQWNENNASKKIEKGKKNLYELKKQKAEIEYKVRSIRESESIKHSIVDGVYSGTTAKIALTVQKERDLYGWFDDDISHDLKCPFSIHNLTQLRSKLKDLTPEKKEQLRLKLPIVKNDYPDLDTFSRLVQDEKKLIGKISNREEVLKSDFGQCLVRSKGIEPIQNIISEILRLNAVVDSISKRPLPWIKAAIYDMLSDRDTPWKDLLGVLSKKLTGLKDKSYLFENIKFDMPDGIDRKKLLGDAKQLHHYIEKGGKLGFGILAPKVVRRTKYIFKVIGITGQERKTLDPLKKIVDFLELQETVDYCWMLWDGKMERIGGPLFLQIGELEELMEALARVVGLHSHLENVKGAILKVEGLGGVPWHNKEACVYFLNVCQVYVSIFDLEKIRNEFEHYESRINVFKNNTSLAHPFTDDLINAISERNIDEFLLLINKIDRYKEEVEVFEGINSTITHLSELIPKFTKKLLSNFENAEFDKSIYQFEHAWNWARVRSWLDGLLGKDDVESLGRLIQQIENEIRNQLTELASLMAWEFCFNRMQDSHRRHLMGWQQAIKKIGKGTGKHAPKHRKNAQEHLDQCREAIPAWVMPLHRVYETVKPTPEVFDVIIVDEASQCGPESLPLMFLAKKIIVVGDEQQISPEAVGVTQERVHSLMDEYLYDFSHADSFAPDSSLFDHAKRRFNNRIVLREHFRCMPEIIRFSNDLCYSSTPLIPLRQYPPNRLEPLVSCHVPKGFREGETRNAINRPEAEELVEAVINCCNDEKYEDKTMGVIVLQGYAQAVLIENMLLEQLGAEEMERRRLICGNPYSFQGDERNIIFLSMIADSNARNVFNRPADQRRFNVAASRAQDQMWLFHTATLNDLSQHCLRKRLLEYFRNPQSQISRALGEEAEDLTKLAYSANRLIEKPPIPFDSWFEVDVALKVASRGYRVVPQFPFAGRRIDLVIEGNKSKLAVECDGDHWHGAEEYNADMERQRMLERCGWHFFRIRECSFYSNMDTALEKLWYELDKRGIQSISAESSCNVDDQLDDKDKSDNEFQSQSVKSYNDLFSADRENSNSENIQVDKEKTFKTFVIDNIQQALALKSSDVRELVIRTLKRRPNYSCVKSAMAGLILKELNVISRSNPRKEFGRKVNQALRYLERNGRIETYKSKNVRIRLVK